MQPCPPRLTHSSAAAGRHCRRRRSFALSALAVASSGLALLGCASLGGPTVFTLGEAELQTLVGRAFPQQRRVLELLDLELRLPSVRLLPEHNRLALSLAVEGRDRLSARALQGAIDFDTALRWEPADQSLRLTQVRVQRLSLGAAPAAGVTAGTGTATVTSSGAWPPTDPGSRPGTTAGTPVSGAGVPSAWAERIGHSVAARLLDDLVVYRLTPERRTELARLGVAPSAVTVTARGVEFTLAKPRTVP